ncbi:MAG: hypothetical protein H6815_04650 [Phycisphaeraceae bacterium]|nr:hypothetical protein [Phycisphaerales bacterium]MCB9859723.1 hypothetical protein [Phycisphaeraceae bacterium]
MKNLHVFLCHGTRTWSLAFLVLASGAAHAQNIRRAIALSGDSFPSALPVDIAGFAVPAVSHTGQIAVAVTLTGPFVTPDDDTGILYHDPFTGITIPLEREGTSPPGTTQGEMYGGFGTGLGTPPFSRINVGPNGEVIFRASMVGPTVTSANDIGMWWYYPVVGGQSPLMINREGAVLPLQQYTVDSFFTYEVCPGVPESPATATLSGSGITSANNTAIIMGFPIGAGPFMVAQEGSLIAGPGSPELAGFGAGDTISHTAINLVSSRFVSFRSRLRGSGVSASNDDAIHIDFLQTNQIPAIVAREGDPVPPQFPVVGAIHGGLFQPPTTAEPDFAAFLGRVAGPGIGTNNDEVLWWYVENTNTLLPLAVEGQPIPSAPQWFYNGFFSYPAITAGGTTVFASQIDGPGITAGVNDRALFSGSGSAAQIVLQRGDTHPDLAAGETFFGLFDIFCINPNDTIAVFTKIEGPNVQLGVNDEAVLRVSVGPVSRVEIIARLGDTIEVAPGDMRTISGIAFADGNGFNAGGTDGRPSMLQDNGAIVYRLDFTNGTSGIFRSQRCYANCNGSSTINIFDYICFGNAFANNDPYADCDGNGVLNIFDYICYGNAYAAGCP